MTTDIRSGRVRASRVLGLGAVVALSGVLSTACVGTYQGGRADARYRAGGLPSELVASELSAQSDAPSVLVAIQRLRPRFLRPRPSARTLRGQAPRLSVFIDGSFAGDPSVLRMLAVQDVQVVRFLQPTQAAVRYGTAQVGDGIIEVRLLPMARGR